MREIKEAKAIIERKISELEDKTSKLIAAERNTLHAGFDVNHYLFNFEMDKERSKRDSQRIARLRQEQADRLAVHKEIETENRKLREIKQNQQSKDKIVSIKQNRDRVLNSVRKMNKSIEEEVSSFKMLKKSEYPYLKMLKEYSKKTAEEEERQKIEEIKQHLKRRELLKPINKAELDSFSAKYMEQRGKFLTNLEADRKYREKQQKNLSVEKSRAYKEVVKSLEREKEEREFSDYKEKLMVGKMHDYAKLVNKMKMPQGSEFNRKQVEHRILEMNVRRVKPHVRKTFGVLFKTPKTAKPLNKASSIEKRTPLARMPDYLKELKTNERDFFDEIKSKLPKVKRNYSALRIGVHLLEERADRKLQLAKFKPVEGNDERLYAEASEMLVKAAETRLKMLETLTLGKSN